MGLRRVLKIARNLKNREDLSPEMEAKLLG